VSWNQPWTFHLEPSSVFFFDLSAEVGDASISYVQNHLGEVGGAFLPGSVWTPWSSHLIARVNVRAGTRLADALLGTSGRDLLTGGGGRDILQGFDGDDRLHGGAGDDRLDGGGGDDLLMGGAGGDRIDGGAGRDTVSYATDNRGVTVTLGAFGRSNDGERLLNVENAIGGRGGDRLTGDPLANLMDGGAGSDALAGAAGADTLAGGAGNDRLTGGPGADTFVFAAHEEAETDTITDFQTGPGGDVLDLSALAPAESFEEFQRNSVAQQGAGTVVTVADSLRIVLDNFQASRLTSASVRLSAFDPPPGPFSGRGGGFLATFGP
ncbi:MAG TPA: calcium-binding protein, partial [Azospirillaceae bacterium]|nr:calcium-binding protein [Azospirillaceae bacterium]